MINKIIKKAEKFLEYEDNWDEEGSKGYKKETLDRVEKLLREGYKSIRKKLNGELPMPYVLPGPGGGFDVLWEHGGFTLLLHVPEDKNKEIDYYLEGKDKMCDNRHKVDIPNIEKFFLALCDMLDKPIGIVRRK